jgi:hypothetical protein
MIHTPEELVKVLEDRLTEHQRQQLAAKTQKESLYLGGVQNGLQEAIFYLKEHIKTVEEE